MERVNRRAASAAPLASDRPSRLWWVYFGYLVAMGLIGIGPYLKTVEGELSRRNLLVSTAAIVLNLVGVVGLWGYIRSRRLAWSGFWQICLGLTVIQMIFSASLFVRSLTLSADGAFGAQRTISLLGLAGLALGLPLVVALWRYAFLSPRIWRS